jgi:hypothetical protein
MRIPLGLKFHQGDTVSLFGAVGPTLGPYDVKIDGQSIGTFNATKQNYAAQVALYHGGGLGAGDHTLEVINQPTSTGQSLAIDFAMVAGFPASSASSTASASASASSSASVGSKSPRCALILSAPPHVEFFSFLQFVGGGRLYRCGNSRCVLCTHHCRPDIPADPPAQRSAAGSRDRRRCGVH